MLKILHKNIVCVYIFCLNGQHRVLVLNVSPGSSAPLRPAESGINSDAAGRIRPVRQP